MNNKNNIRRGINFYNIEMLLQAVDITNDERFAKKLNQNNFLCYFLRTGDYKCFTPNGRKQLKKVNFKELLIDIQSTLLLFDGLKSLESYKYSVVNMYNSNYFKILHSNLPTLENGYLDYVQKYQQNLNIIIENNLADADSLIYIFLSRVLAFISNMDYEYTCLNDNTKYLDYNSAIKTSEIVLLEKNNLLNSGLKNIANKIKVKSK